MRYIKSTHVQNNSQMFLFNLSNVILSSIVTNDLELAFIRILVFAFISTKNNFFSKKISKTLFFLFILQQRTAGLMSKFIDDPSKGWEKGRKLYFYDSFQIYPCACLSFNYPLNIIIMYFTCGPQFHLQNRTAQIECDVGEYMQNCVR